MGERPAAAIRGHLAGPAPELTGMSSDVRAIQRQYPFIMCERIDLEVTGLPWELSAPADAEVTKEKGGAGDRLLPDSCL